MSLCVWKQYCYLVTLLLFGWVRFNSGAELRPRDFAVELTAEVAVDPPQITLRWQGDQYARSYVINRKARTANQWTQVGTAAGHDTWFVDRDVRPGVGYEYQVVKEGTLQYMGYGYIYAAINLPPVDQRGRVILLVEASVAEALKPELDRLELDLIGDGWQVARQDVPRTARPPEVRELIEALYAQDPANTRSVFLFGNIPVPYSGDMAPDQHDNHRGAWPTDTYYADLDGVWTDTVTATMTETWWGKNLPDDGKFDQNFPPSELELQVGRVDLSRLTCFINKSPPRNEIDLLRQYLDKHHRFRHGQLKVDQRALIYDRIGLTKPEPLATMAWRNFTPFVGSEIKVIKWGEYMPTVSSESFLWTSGVAGGGFSHADGVGTADAFALNTVNAVFVMFCGSYYGDWDNESNFLRAALGAKGTVLASMYSGQPQWICHTMALGEPIGAAAIMTQQNGPEGIYIPHNGGAGMVHVTLHGDPTLRAHPVAPPGKVGGLELAGSVLLTWDPTTAPKYEGYFVYQGDAVNGPYVRITDQPVQSTSYLAEGGAGKHFLVKTAALTTSPSGAYWNTSQGAYFPEPHIATEIRAPSAPRNLVVKNVKPDGIELSWLSTSLNHTGFEVERLSPGEPGFVRIATVSATTLDYQDGSLPVTGRFGYRVRAINSGGASDYSNPVFPSTQPATVEFVGLDTETKGAWMGAYGEDGYVIPDRVELLPTNSSLSLSNAFIYKPGFIDDDLRMLPIPDTTNRNANCWVHRFPFALHLNFGDDAIHQVALYAMDYNRNGNYFDLAIHDAVTGQKLDERRMATLNEGVFAIYNIRRQVYIQILPPSDYRTNIEIYGLFFDTPKIQPVRVEPAGGAFAGKTLVTLSSLTPGVEIHYTLDGSTPDKNSRRYIEPFWIYENTSLRAQGFKEGYPPTEVSAAEFRSAFTHRVGFRSWDTESRGTWTFNYGVEGFWVPHGEKQLPGYAEVTIRPDTAWLWSESTTDDRAPFRDRTASARVAGAWYAEEELEVDIGVFDTRKRFVGFYFVDWDQRGRVQEIELIDSAGAVRERFTLENFAGGKYLLIELKGYAKLRIRRKAGDNAVLNGVFFDPAPLEISPGTPLPLADLRVSDGQFGFSVTGMEDHRFCVDESVNLKDWECVITNIFTGRTYDLELPVNGERATFIRAHIVP